MNRYSLIYKILCLLCAMLFFWGCGDEPKKPPSKPKVIRKKIAARPAAKETKSDEKEEYEKQKQIITASVSDSKKTQTDSQSVEHKPEDLSKAQETIKDQQKKAKDKKEIGEDILNAISEIKSKKESDKYIGYNPEGKTDPFEPLFKDEPKEAKKTEIAKKDSEPKVPPRPLTPLEKLDLGQLKLVGIIRAESGNKAMVEEASGKGYIIVKGTYIGIHSGKVVNILKDRVIVEEEDKDMLGKITIRKRELKFQRPSGDDYYEM